MTIMLATTHVLVVEDQLDNQQILTELLQIAGVTSITVGGSGWQALRAARASLPHVDLILLDLHLPGEDGYAVLQRIRATPRFQTARVVAVSADAGPSSVARARNTGFDGFISKPLDFERFPTQIQAILQGHPVWDT
jgi:two-component system, cell cycle response regulator DivK